MNMNENTTIEGFAKLEIDSERAAAYMRTISDFGNWVQFLSNSNYFSNIGCNSTRIPHITDLSFYKNKNKNNTE